MKLYYSPGACSMASHVVLHEIGKPFEIEKVSTKTKVMESGRDYWAINPKGAVPALELDGGEVLTEGSAILQYIADTNGATDLAPPAGTLARARVQEMLSFIGSELHKSFSPLFHPGKTDAEKDAAREVLQKKFEWLESRLADGRAYLTGSNFTVADAYAFVVTNWSNVTGVSLEAWPKLKDYVARVGARPSVQAAMKAEGVI
ncbi:glutathione transferase GstA [Rhizobium sp. AC44/96]|uniref:glutathione transferase GstA n=1 Tax=Rhizobium sp. AC44/96 TaxID=1841654 RepID=UPI00080F7931|nr:glutathione transferase GstA [Rhizobium sp. AC44/96]OCJ14037.1 glutathione transferase GstA [Rhizobium sp. AC44/96]